MALLLLLLLLVTAAGVVAHATLRVVATVRPGACVALCMVSDTSQYTFFPRLVESDPVAAAPWYFHDVDSLPSAIDLAGSGLLALGAWLLASLLYER